MSYIGITLVVLGAALMLDAKLKQIEIITTDPSGNSRLVKKFVVLKSLPDYMGVSRWEIMRERYIVQIKSFNGSWIDSTWGRGR